jgi:hypothetical protein
MMLLMTIKVMMLCCAPCDVLCSAIDDRQLMEIDSCQTEINDY